MMLWKNKLVPILFALAGVLFLVPTVKSVIKGQPLNLPNLILALVCLVFALIFGIVGGRRSGDASGPPSG